MTVTFSLAILESGRSNTGVEGLTEVNGETTGGFDEDLDEDEEGVEGRAPEALDGGGGAGDFLDRNGDMEDLSREVEDIGGRFWSGELWKEKIGQVSFTCRHTILPPLVPPK